MFRLSFQFYVYAVPLGSHLPTGIANFRRNSTLARSQLDLILILSYHSPEFSSYYWAHIGPTLKQSGWPTIVLVVSILRETTRLLLATMNFQRIFKTKILMTGIFNYETRIKRLHFYSIFFFLILTCKDLTFGRFFF